MGLFYYCFSDVCRKEVTCLVSLCSCHGDSVKLNVGQLCIKELTNRM